MRVPVLLSLCVLSACASSGDAQWRAVQRERLDRLYKPRSPREAVVELLGHEPRDLTAPQEPRHIDQQEPPAAGIGPRALHEKVPALAATATLGRGNVAVRTPGTTLDDRTQAWFGRVTLDKGSGAAMQASVWTSDHELFDGAFLNDGIAPAHAEASLLGAQLFPHVRFDTWSGGAWHMPIRLGVFADWQRIDHQAAKVQREWLSLGPRLSLEPAWRVLGDDASHLELFGRFGGELGPAWFTEEFRGGDDRDTTWRLSGEAEAGLRARAGRMRLELGYGLHQTLFGAVDSDLYGDRNRTDLQRQQLFLGFGVEF